LFLVGQVGIIVKNIEKLSFKSSAAFCLAQDLQKLSCYTKAGRRPLSFSEGDEFRTYCH
jgi:hypothetical protein